MNITRESPESLPKLHNNEFPKPGLGEWLAMMGLLLAFWGFHVSSYNWYPTPWSDEVTYSEPAINLAQGHGFTTSIWQFQAAGTFWAVNPPLYGLVLSGWVRAMGTSVQALRCFNLTLYTLVVFLLWVAAWKFKLIQSVTGRFMLIGLLQLGFGISLAFRSARPDVLGMFCLAVLFVTFLIPSQRVRGLFLASCAAVAPWIGLQVALYAIIVCFIAWSAPRVATLRDLLCVSLGISIGACLLVVFLVRNDALAAFRLSVHVVTGGGGLGRLGNAVTSYFKDFSSVPLLLALGLFAFRSWGSWLPQTRRIILSVGLVYGTVPLVFNLSADFRSYYAYMIYVPLVLAFTHVFSEILAQQIPGRARISDKVFVGAAMAAMLIGLPLRLLLTTAFCNIAPRPDLRNVLATHLRPDDVVFSEYFTFFEAKTMTPSVYAPFSAKGLAHISDLGLELTPKQRARVDLMIVKPGEKDAMARYFGGEWKAVSEPFGDSVCADKLLRVPIFGAKLQTFFYHAPTARFQVQVFRRVPGT